MVTPRQIFSFAAGLVSSGTISEVQARQAAARAYYSIFLLVRDELNVDTSQTDKGVHQTVKDALFDEVSQTQSAPRYQRVALNLWPTLAVARIDADYHLNQPFPVTRGKEIVELARAIFTVYPN